VPERPRRVAREEARVPRPGKPVRPRCWAALAAARQDPAARVARARQRVPALAQVPARVAAVAAPGKRAAAAPPERKAEVPAAWPKVAAAG